MSHPGSVDIIDFVLLTIYPVGGLFIIEILSRIISRTASQFLHGLNCQYRV